VCIAELTQLLFWINKINEVTLSTRPKKNPKLTVSLRTTEVSCQ
jgi:hypothetical protein